LITCLFIGCRSNADSAANAMKSEPLKFRITWKTYSGRGETIQKIVDTYNADRTARYHIKMVDGDEDLNTIDNLLMQQSSVDIYVLPYRFVKYFGAENKLMDLTTDFAREKDFFYPNLWNLGVVNGKTYGIPGLGHSIGLIYNKDLLAKAGVDPQDIKSVQDLLGACEKIEANTQARGIGLVGANHNDVSWMVNQFVYGFGSTLVDKEGLKVAVNNDKSRNAIAFYKNDLGQHAQKTWVNDTGVEVMDYFRKQQVAFEFQGLWGVTDIWKNGHPFEAGVISLDDLGLYSEVGPMIAALPVNLNTEKKEAAVDFIRFLVSKQAQEKIMDGEYSPEHGCLLSLPHTGPKGSWRQPGLLRNIPSLARF
jgi:ABC-type glycerol-3-phosphate transport system substrate-binding protein